MRGSTGEIQPAADPGGRTRRCETGKGDLQLPDVGDRREPVSGTRS